MADRRSITPNTVLRAVRELEFQMSRGEFAAAVRASGRAIGENVGCDARLVAAWEDGDVGCPRAVYQRILTRMTGRSMADLGFRIAPALSVPPAAAYGPQEESDPVERRNFLRDGTGIALGPLGTKKKTPGKIGTTQVRAVTRAVAELYATDHDQGSASLRRAAAEALHTAYQWLQNGTFASSRTEARLRSTTGALSIAAGWLSFDSGRAGDAHSLYGEALAAARIADDPELEAHAFGCLSSLAKASGRPREAISAAQGAQTVARGLGSPRLLSLFHMREAGGWALMGDASATDQAIVRAHHLYAKGPAEADPPWLDFYTPGELAGLESLARADLGQHERAASGVEQAVLLYGEAFARNRALYTADVAIQHAVRDRPEPEVAAAAAGKVLAFLPEVRSDRLLRSLHNVAGALQRHRRVPVVADWIEEYRTITATTGGRS